MRDDIRPISHELRGVWITGDGKSFLNKEDAKAHQELLERMVSIDGCD